MESAPDFDLYDALGVEKDATPEQIKRAYKRRSSEFHPDRNKDPGAAEQMARVNRANDILSDPEKRAIYDKHGTTFDPIDKTAHDTLVAKVNDLIDKLDVDGDIVGDMRNWIRTQERKLAANRVAANKDIEKLERQQKRIRKRDGSGSIFDKLFEVKIRAAREALERMDHQEAVLKRMDEMLNDYMMEPLLRGPSRVTLGVGSFLGLPPDYYK